MPAKGEGLVLWPEHEAAGLFIKEEEDFVYLMRKGEEKPLATWSSRAVTREKILLEAGMHVYRNTS